MSFIMCTVLAVIGMVAGSHYNNSDALMLGNMWLVGAVIILEINAKKSN